MKKTLLSVAIVAMTMSLSAQFYAGLGVGYGLGADKQIVGVEIENTTMTNIYGSSGQGFNTVLKLGYMFSENIGAELGVSYLIGANITNFKTDSETIERKSTALRLAPQLVAKLDNGLYSRIGLFIPATGKTVVTISDSDPNAPTDGTIEAKGSFSLGFIGAVGYGYALSESMDLFCELEYIGLEMKTKSTEITKMEVGGTDLLPFMTTSEIETEFVDELDLAEVPDPNTPTKELRTTSPFSSFGLNVGVVMKF